MSARHWVETSEHGPSVRDVDTDGNYGSADFGESADPARQKRADPARQKRADPARQKRADPARQKRALSWWDDRMTTGGYEFLKLLIVAGVAAIATTGLIAVLFRWLQRFALARPNARSSHVTPTAQGGGIAVVAVVLAVVWCVLAVTGVSGTAGDPGLGSQLLAPLQPWRLAVVTLAVAAVALLGAVDDVRPLPVRPRLAVQVIVAGLLVATVPSSLRSLPALPAVIETGILTIGLVWFVNLANFMDGIDEITVAEFVPISIALASLGVSGVLPSPCAVIAAALAGALLGFWPWNRHVAHLFLGDVGSLAIGALIGWMLILLAGRGHVAAALLLPLYYLSDATLTLYRRWRRGERLSDAHRSHAYQRATTAGRTVPDVTRAVLIANIALATLALGSVAIGRAVVDVAALVLGSAVVAMLLGYLVPDDARRAV